MKILVLRIGRAGDMVMITPALNAIIERYPNAEITVLTSPDGRRVLNDFHPQVKNLWLLDRKKIFSFLQNFNLKKAIQQHNFEHVFCFETKMSFQKLFQRSSAQKHILKIDKNLDINFAERCLKLIDDSANRQPYYIHLPVKEAAIQQSFDLLSTCGIEKDTFVVGIHPSFSGLTKAWGRKNELLIHKSWPKKNWADLSKLIYDYAEKKNIKLKIIMDLLPEERELGESIVELSNKSINLFIPQPNFERYKATLARMDLLIAPDTGPGHIAAAVGTKVLSLFSAKNPNDCAPYAKKENLLILQAEDYADDAKAQFGLATISAQDVFQASKIFLDKK